MGGPLQRIARRSGRPAAAPGSKPLRASAGFTIVELLIVVVVSTMGFVALFGMQTATIRGMGNTKRIIEATHLAENFLEHLRLELMAWTPRAADSLAGNQGNFPHVFAIPETPLPTGPAAAQVGAQTQGFDQNAAPGWVQADRGLGTDRRVSVVGDVHQFGWNNGIRGAMLGPGVDDEDVPEPFCLHYRLTWLIPDQAMRAEVEVSWPTEDADMNRFVQCDQLASANLSEMRSVTLATTISVNTFRR